MEPGAIGKRIYIPNARTPLVDRRRRRGRRAPRVARRRRSSIVLRAGVGVGLGEWKRHARRAHALDVGGARAAGPRRGRRRRSVSAGHRHADDGRGRSFVGGAAIARAHSVRRLRHARVTAFGGGHLWRAGRQRRGANARDRVAQRARRDARRSLAHGARARARPRRRSGWYSGSSARSRRRATCAPCCLASDLWTRSCLARRRRFCSPLRLPPALCRRAERFASIRWRRFGSSLARPPLVPFRDQRRQQ